MTTSQTISEQHRLYGELLCAFANAKSSDEAGERFLENIQKAFNLQPQRRPLDDIELYAEENKFPTTAKFNQESISVLNNNMQNVFCKLQKEWPKNFVNEFYKVGFWGDTGIPTIDLRERVLKEIFDNCKIKTLMSKLSTEEQNQIESIAEYYFGTLLCEHDYILNLQELLRFSLDSIFEKKMSGEFCYEFTEKFNNNFLQLYNEIKSHIYRIYDAKDCLLFYRQPWFEAEFFLYRFESMPYYNLKEYYAEPISYCLIEFLLEPQNQKYLKKCQLCSDFFIAIRLRKDQKYCPVCSRKNKMPKEKFNEYMQDYRKDKKKTDNKSKLEKEISKLIAQGYKPKEAKELADLKIKDK